MVLEVVRLRRKRLFGKSLGLGVWVLGFTEQVDQGLLMLPDFLIDKEMLKT